MYVCAVELVRCVDCRVLVDTCDIWRIHAFDVQARASFCYLSALAEFAVISIIRLPFSALSQLRPSRVCTVH